jgi:hypothetical protein
MTEKKCHLKILYLMTVFFKCVREIKTFSNKKYIGSTTTTVDLSSPVKSIFQEEEAGKK